MKFMSKIFIVALFFCLIMSLGFVAAQDNTTLNGNDVKVNEYKDNNVKIYEENTNDVSSNSNDDNINENDLNTVSNSKDQETLKDSEKTFKDVQDAIDAASSGDVIYLNGTTYNWSNTITVGKANLTIDGGFEDHVGVSILDGNGALQTIMRVSANNITLRNIKFINGGKVGMPVQGGAIQWLQSLDGTVSNCVFINNGAFAGGAINYQCTNMNISNCIFENNSAQVMGGAISAGSSKNFFNSNTTLFNCTFKRNGAASNGGAISVVTYKDFNVDNCTFLENYATNGGAITITNITGNFSNSVFENNSAQKRGGAISSGQASDKNSTIANCSFSQNNATDGGAVIVERSNFAIDNSTFSNNSADCGGGLVVEGASTVNITQSEFVGNEGNIVYNNTNDTVNVDNATEEASDDDLIQIMPDMSKINITIDNYTYEDKGTIDCVITDSVYYDSSIYVIINDEIYSALIDSEGKATIELPLLNAGKYSLNIIYNGTETYSRTYVPVNFTVYKKAIDMAVNTTNITLGESAFFDVVLNETMNGIAYIVYGGNNYTVDVSAGRGTIEIPNLTVGDHTLNVFFDSENYNASSLVEITVSKGIVEMVAEADDVALGDIARINVVLNHLIDGVVYTIYGGVQYNGTISSGKGTIEIPGLELGNYTLTVVYGGSEEYEAAEDTVDFSVKEPISMNVTAEDITYGDSASIDVILNYADAEGMVYILYNDTLYAANISDSKATIKIPNLNAGDYTFDVIYNGSEKYNATSAVVSFVVNKHHVHIIPKSYEVTYPQPALIEVELEPAISGVVYIVYNGTKYNGTITDGKGSIEIPDINAGDYTFNVIYDGSENYDASSSEVDVYVKKSTIIMDVNAEDITIGDIAYINVSLWDIKPVDGVVYILYNGNNYTANIVNSTGTIEIPGLGIGDYALLVIYDGDDNYNNNSAHARFTVSPINVTMEANADNITVNETARINVVLDPAIDGVVYIVYNGTNYTADITGGTGTIEIPNLDAGDYTFTVYYDGDENHTTCSAEVNLTVKELVDMDISYANITYGDIAYINVRLMPLDAEGVAYIVYGGKNYTVNLTQGVGRIEIPDLNAGNYTFDVMYSGCEKYNATSAVINLTVYKNAVDIDLNADNITFGDIARINVVLYPAINGVVYIEHGGKNYTANITDGEGTIEIPDLVVGDYTFTVIYDESENYNASSEVVNFSVLKKDTNITVTVDNITLGESAFINVVLNPDAEGVVYIEFNGTIYTADLSEGKGTIVIPNLTPSTYDLRVIYNGSEIYNNVSQEFQITVHKHNSTMALNVTDVIYGETVSIFIKTDCPDSEVYVDINGKIYSTTLVDGEGVINIPGLNADRYLVDVSYVGNENYSSCDIPIIFTVAQLNTTTTANAATFVINYGGTYKAIVKSNNKGLAGVKVSFILNGKIIGSATTDSNGVATIKLTAAQLKSAGAGSRALTSLFAGNKNYKASSITKTIKINKEATKFINVKSVKKSYKSTAKSMQLTATLKDSKNKVVKSQWVYFKVNNKKTYKVKTNSKGVATLSLNAAKIKACKINKRGNYKFTVTFKTTKVYNQATKRGTLKVVR